MPLKMLGKFEANIVDKNSKASQETIDVTKGAGGSLLSLRRSSRSQQPYQPEIKDQSSWSS